MRKKSAVKNLNAVMKEFATGLQQNVCSQATNLTLFPAKMIARQVHFEFYSMICTFIIFDWVIYYPLNPTCQKWSHFIGWRRFIGIQCYAWLDFLRLKQILFNARGLRCHFFRHRYDTDISQVWKVDTETILILLKFWYRYWHYEDLKFNTDTDAHSKISDTSFATNFC